MRNSIFLFLALPAMGSVSIYPGDAKLLPNQCFVLTAHFSAPVAKDGVRAISVAALDPRIQAFAKPDCSGGGAITISGHIQSYAFSVLALAGATPGKIEVRIEGNGEIGKTKVAVLPAS